MVMDIAAMSMQMANASLNQAVNIATMKKAMDSQETEAAALLNMLDSAAPQAPAPGHSFYARA